MPERREDETTIRCESCGRERELAPAAATPAETITHCEWCGAEYPVPEPPTGGGGPAAR